ncbi:MAG: pentapeptide repeat-containing protein [Thermodesulfobacteriota bacterium]
MRSGFIPLALIALLYICVSSCGGSSGGDSSQAPPVQDSMEIPKGIALSENEIKSNPILQVMADRDTYVTYLEPASSSEESNLTGGLGFDVFSYVYEIAINHTICWEDDDPGAAHFMTIANAQGEQVLRVDANGGCVTEFIAPGIYEARVDHDNFGQSTLSIFFVPQLPQVASTGSGVLDSVLDNLYVLISKLDPVHISNAQTEILDITTTVTTNSCSGCSLEGILFRSQNLSGVNFEGADLNGAILDSGNFSGTNLSNASLESADIRGVNFREADLKGADLRFAEINECTNFSDAELTGAVWIDKCICANTACSNCVELPMVSPPTDLIGEEGCIVFENPLADDPGENPIVGPIDIPDDIPISSAN